MIYGPTLPISVEVDESKYRQAGETFEESISRLAKVTDDLFVEPTKEMLLRQRFLPAGRIRASVGSKRSTTAFNCYVVPPIPDDMEGIMDSLKYAALTMKQGGGVGYDFSTLRPRGATIKTLDSQSSGPVSFMEIFNAMCGTISSAGHRRGAQMGVLRIDHPDIEEFIEAKTNTTRLTNFNISVAVTDEFMEAVKNDHIFTLRWNGQPYKHVYARELWDKLMQATWHWSEPGVLFIDRINARNNLWYCETITTSNPCVPYNTPILTDTGYYQIGDLVGKTVNVWNGFEFSAVTPRLTGVDQPMLNVELSDGSELTCTTAHTFILDDGTRVKAEELTLGDKLQKSEWPVIYGTDVHNIDYYAQGFFSGDGWVKASTGTQYIGLYGDKCNIQHHWNEDSRNTYEIRGGYVGTDTSLTKDYLRFSKGTFQPKTYIPHEASMESKRLWMAGLADSDGCVCSSGTLQISSKDREFLLGVKALLNTMGANGNLQIMKDCWRISISGSWAAVLQLPTKRLQLTPPSRDSRRFLKVVSVTPMENCPEVFCFTEPKNHSGVFNGVYTGQCGEQPLPPHGACLLGSFNLVKYVKAIFGSHDDGDLEFDFKQFERDVSLAVRLLDNVIDNSNYPHPEQRAEAQAKRRMGLGVTGLANAGEALGFEYASSYFLEWAEKVFKTLRDAAYNASCELAGEKGAFPLFDQEKYGEGHFIQNLPADLQAKIYHMGIRNSHLISFAPTGTISLAADNVSSGIEPVFSYGFDRTINMPDGVRTERVDDYGVRKFGVRGKTADQLTPTEHVLVQSLAQMYSDSAVSKTVNVGPNVTFEEFKDIYMLAYNLGAKGSTTFRINGKRIGILVADVDEPQQEEVDGAACTIDLTTGQRTCG